MSIKVIGFDFDGVIVDTTHVKSQCFLELFKDSAHFEEIKKYESQNQARPRSDKISEILLGILHKKNLSELDFYLAEYKKLLDEKLIKLSLIGGIEKFLKSVEKLKIPNYIVSSAPRAEIEKLLAHHNLKNYFSKIFDFNLPKASALETIIREQKIDSQEMIFFGDQMSDFKAASAANCRFIAINPAVHFPSGTLAFNDFTSFDLKLLR